MADVRSVTALAALLLVVGQNAPSEDYAPARLVEGPAPSSAPPIVLGGGEVLLEVTVGNTGQVARIDRLRVTPPYTDLVASAVEGWRFSPAEVISVKEGRRRIESRVLVAAIYRPPATYVGTTIGEVPRDLMVPSSAVPVPHEMIAPAFPPSARGSGVVTLEIELGTDGRARNTRVFYSGGGFDSAALQAAERWTFSPARLPDGPIPSFAYVVMGFREPVVSPIKH
jgi:TonB family protein